MYEKASSSYGDVMTKPKPNQIASVLGTQIKIRRSPLQALPSSPHNRLSPKNNLRENTSTDVSHVMHNLNSKNHSLLHSVYSTLYPNTTSNPNSTDNSFCGAHLFEESNDSRGVQSQRRKEISCLRNEKRVSKNSNFNSFGRQVNMCGQNFRSCVAVTLFEKLGREPDLNDCCAFIKGCLKNIRKSGDEDFVVEQISILYKVLRFMKEKEFLLDEETYGPILLYFIDMRMEEEFHFFLDVIKDKNDAALPILGYYEMSLYIRVNKEEKIQELCHYISTDDSDETTKLREIYLSALCDGDRKSDVLQLFEVIDVTKVSSKNNLAKIFKFLGRLSLESYAETFLLAFKDRGYGADTISKLIFNYAIGAPNLEVEDVISEFKKLHLLLEMEPHLKSYEKMVLYCCEVHGVHVALDVVQQLCEEGGLTISQNMLNSLLHSIENNFEFHLGRRIYALICDKDLKPTKDMFKMLISFSVKMKDFDNAYAMINDLKKFNLDPTASMYNVIMAGYFREKKPCAARKVFNQMKLAGVQPDSQTYFYLIHNCNSETKIIEYNEEMKNAEIEMTKFTFMAIISAYASCGLFEKAKEVILDIRNHSDLNEIRSVLVYSLASNGQLHDALNIYKEMKESGLDVMPRSSFSLIEYCQSELDLNELLNLLEEVRNSEYWISCSRVVLSYCLRNKHFSAAVELLKQLVDECLDNELALGMLFDETFVEFAEMESPDLQFAMSILEAIEKEMGVSPSRKCLDFLLTASIKAKDVQHSRLIWKKYKQLGLPYNVMNYLGFYQALLAGGRHQSAKSILSKIPTGDLEVRTIIKACQTTYPDLSVPKKVEEIKMKKIKKKAVRQK